MEGELFLSTVIQPQTLDARLDSWSCSHPKVTRTCDDLPLPCGIGLVPL